MEGVFLPGFGDVGLEWPRDEGSDEHVASAEAVVQTELLLDSGKGGVLPQACCYLSAVLDRKQAKIAVALLEHEVVCLPYLLRGGTEWEPGVSEARFGEGAVCAILVAVFLGLGLLDVGGDSGGPGGVVGRHDERSFSV